jgi:uncharacterized membrane protein
MLLGSLVALGVSIVVGALIPNDTLTLEMLSRGKPDILDLFVGLFAGAAAAYATARPKVTAALVGVAVEAALVPPVATVGLALTEGNMLVAEGAGFLFITNLVAIVIGAAAMFYLMGIQGLYKDRRSPLLLRRVLLSMILGLGLISRSYPLSPALSEMIRDRIEQVPGVDLLQAGRSGVDYESSDIGIVLYGSEPVPLFLKQDLVAIVKDFRGEDVSVEVVVLEAGKWVES